MGKCSCRGCGSSEEKSVCDELLGDTVDDEEPVSEDAELTGDTIEPLTGYMDAFYDQQGNLDKRSVARFCAFLVATGAIINMLYGYTLELMSMSKRLSSISPIADLADRAAAEHRL